MSKSIRTHFLRGVAIGAALLATLAAQPQSIRTAIRGGGGNHRSLNGTVATQLGIVPLGVAAGVRGDFYVSETDTFTGFSGRVLRVDNSGRVTVVAGNGENRALRNAGDGAPAIFASLNVTGDVVVSAAGDVYVRTSNPNSSSDQRVRKIDAATGIITTVAGCGNLAHSGDGGPAARACLGPVVSIAVDRQANVYIGETATSLPVGSGHYLRKVDGATGIISTIAGKGSSTFSGDGGAAVAAGLSVAGIAVGADGRLYIADGSNHRVRVIDRAGIITTFAGRGDPGFSGDGGRALEAQLNAPSSVAVDDAGNVFVGDEGNRRVRRIDAASGTITTIAGSGSETASGDGGRATAAGMSVNDVAVTSTGVLIRDQVNFRVRAVDLATGVVTTVAGTGVRPQNSTFSPSGLAFAPTGELYVGDQLTVKRFDVRTGQGVVVAGTGEKGITDDGGKATEARLSEARDVVIDRAGNIYFMERVAVTSLTGRIRKVDAKTGIITTHAGNLGEAPCADGPATVVSICASDIEIGPDDNIWFVDNRNARIRRIHRPTGLVETVAGGAPGYSGDGGPALAAQMRPVGIGFSPRGDALYVADQPTANNVIRRIDLTRPDRPILTIAGGGAQTGERVAADSARLSAIDVLADEEYVYIVANGNRDGQSYRYIQRLDPSRVIETYAVSGAPVERSRIEGDNGPAKNARSIGIDYTAIDASGQLYFTDLGAVRVIGSCRFVAPPRLTQPVAGESGVRLAPQLSWASVDGAASYDVLLDTVDPPAAVVASSVAATAYAPANLQPLTKYYWRVVSKRDPYCTETGSTPSPVQSFTTVGTCGPAGAVSAFASVAGSGAVIQWTEASRASTYDVLFGSSNPPRSYRQNVDGTTIVIGPLPPGTYYYAVRARARCDDSFTTTSAIQSLVIAGECPPIGRVSLSGPADGSDESPGVLLSWSATAGAASYDVSLSAGAETPQLYARAIAATSLQASRLRLGQTYSWRVTATSVCGARVSESEVRHFTVGPGCRVPSAPRTIAAPLESVAGATYAISWPNVADLDREGLYRVERSRDASFEGVEWQETTATSASFISLSPGTYYHRVRAFASCGDGIASSVSEVATVTVQPGPPNVIFTLLLEALVVKTGDNLEERTARFALENLSAQPVQVLYSPLLLDGLPFFTISNGEPSPFTTLEPRRPRTFDIQYAGPPTERPGTYSGLVYVAGVGQPLAFSQQIFVNLRVGAESGAAAPTLLVNGVETARASFVPLDGNDVARPPLLVDIFNSGTVPLDLAGEIGPDAWIDMEKGWNSTPVPPRSFRTLRLTTRRTRAPNGSALPRSTYLAVRNENGRSARLLIEDSGGVAAVVGREEAPDPNGRSLIVPWIESGCGLLLTNTGSTAVAVTLIFTPQGHDGLSSAAVRRVAVTVPPNDVVNLADPLKDVFSVTAGRGSLEIRAAPEKIDYVVARASCQSDVPVLRQAFGASVGERAFLTGIAADDGKTTSLVLAETSGRDGVSVVLELYNATGGSRGELAVDLAAFGSTRFEDVAKSFGVTSLVAGRIELDVKRGGGVVAAVATVADRKGGAGSTNVAALAAHARHKHTFVVRSGRSSTVAISAIERRATVRVALKSASGPEVEQRIAIDPGHSADVLLDAHHPSAVLSVSADEPVLVAGHTEVGEGAGRFFAAIERVEPVPGSTQPLYVDGIAHSPDAAGETWSLLLAELSGAPCTVDVRVYEPGNRLEPIVQKTISMAAAEQLVIANVFQAAGLESKSDDVLQRRKSRVNVAIVVTAVGGSGSVAAALTGRDGSVTMLRPAGETWVRSAAPARMPRAAGKRRAVRP